MSIIMNSVGRTFSEYLILPRKTTKETNISDISLTSRITEDVKIPIPFLSSAMESVTDHRLAVELALHGGLGVLPCSIPIQEQVEYLKKVKKYKAGFVRDVITVEPDDKIKKLVQLEKKYGYSTFPVVKGTNDKKLKGLITEKKYHPKKDLTKKVKERMITLDNLVTGREGITLDKANEKMTESGIGALPIIDEHGCLKSVVFWRDFKEHMSYPYAFENPEDKTLRVAGAVSTHLHEDMERARKLVENGVDFLVIDSSDIYSEFGEDAIKEYKQLGVPIIAGNIVDKDGFNFLADLGADCIKIGQGGGSICTTRRVKAMGRGQATAVMECAKAREQFYKKNGKYIPICSDGGIDSTGDMTIAFALGADTIMMGKYFVGFTESASSLLSKKFTVSTGRSETVDEITAYVKEYWGEASARAKNYRRYGHKDPRTFVIEGDEGYVLHKGCMKEQLPKDLKAIKGAISASSCKGLKEFSQKAKLELQSSKSFREGGLNILK